MPPIYNPLGRKPLQKRSVERIELILTTTHDLLMELPLEEINTNLIAERANIKVGTLYHFFPNKFAIYNALIHQTLSQMDEILLAVLETTAAEKTVEELVEAAVLALAGFWRDSSLLTTLWFALQKHPETQQVVEHFESIWIPVIAERLAKDIPQLTQARAELAAFVILQTIYPLLDQSGLLPPAQARLLVQETCAILKVYTSSLRNMPAERMESMNRQADKNWPVITNTEQ